MILGKCRDCAWWDRTAGTDNGICQRFPPVLAVGKGGSSWQQPETTKDMKCAEFVQEI